MVVALLIPSSLGQGRLLCNVHSLVHHLSALFVQYSGTHVSFVLTRVFRTLEVTSSFAALGLSARDIVVRSLI